MPTTVTSEQEYQSPQEKLSDTELQDARNLFKVFLQAWKNYGLYPEGHILSIRALESLINAFAGFFAKHGSLGLVVENGRLLWRDGVIHELTPEAATDDIIFPLYRDGINWIEFQEGLPLQEVVGFFSIINRYKFLQEETGDDIVTELKDGDFTCIKFKAADILWQDYPLLDFSSIKIPALEHGGDDSHDEPEDKERLDGPEITETFAKSVADSFYNETLWEISTDEHELLQKMVQEEENWHNTEDVFDVLVAILRNQDDKNNFSSALDFTLEEVIETIEQGEFDKLLKLFQSLYQMVYTVTPAEVPWLGPLISRFFQDLSRPEIFKFINAYILTLRDNDLSQIKKIQQVLLYFTPDAIHFLGPVILQTRSREVREMILGVIEHLCLKDMGELEKLLASPDKQLGEALLPILCSLHGERANKIFLQMAEHPSEKVRTQAIKILLAHNSPIVEKLFFHIDDPSKAVRQELLAAVAKQKSPRVENLLLRYMKESLDQKDPEHILDCYAALGSCGSVIALQFLKRILMNQGWNRFTGFGKPLHREAAARALAYMNTSEAKEILRVASESKYQVVRQASQLAMTDNNAYQENSDA